MKKQNLNKRIRLSLGLALLAALLLAVSAAFAQSTMDWWVISGGGGISSGGTASVNSTFGQPITGPSGGGNVTMGAGYWGGIGAAAPTAVTLRNITTRATQQPMGAALVAIILAMLLVLNRAKRKRKGHSAQ